MDRTRWGVREPRIPVAAGGRLAGLAARSPARRSVRSLPRPGAGAERAARRRAATRSPRRSRKARACRARPAGRLLGEAEAPDESPGARALASARSVGSAPAGGRHGAAALRRPAGQALQPRSGRCGKEDNSPSPSVTAAAANAVAARRVPPARRERRPRLGEGRRRPRWSAGCGAPSLGQGRRPRGRWRRGWLRREACSASKASPRCRRVARCGASSRLLARGRPPRTRGKPPPSPISPGAAAANQSAGNREKASIECAWRRDREHHSPDAPARRRSGSSVRRKIVHSSTACAPRLR